MTAPSARDEMDDDQIGYDDVAESCWHEDYEVDFDGRATCDYCRAHWWLTPEQHNSYLKAEAEWMAEYDRHQRRENSPLWRLWGAATGALRQLIRAKPKQPEALDDDLPF